MIQLNDDGVPTRQPSKIQIMRRLPKRQRRRYVVRHILWRVVAAALAVIVVVAGIVHWAGGSDRDDLRVTIVADDRTASRIERFLETAMQDMGEDTERLTVTTVSSQDLSVLRRQLDDSSGNPDSDDESPDALIAPTGVIDAFKEELGNASALYMTETTFENISPKAWYYDVSSSDSWPDSLTRDGAHRRCVRSATTESVICTAQTGAIEYVPADSVRIPDSAAFAECATKGECAWDQYGPVMQYYSSALALLLRRSATWRKTMDDPDSATDGGSQSDTPATDGYLYVPSISGAERPQSVRTLNDRLTRYLDFR